MKTLVVLSLALALVCMCPPPAMAQTMPSTTLTTTVTKDQTTFTVASTAAITAPGLPEAQGGIGSSTTSALSVAFLDQEAISVTKVLSATQFVGKRGYIGGRSAHVAGSLVYLGPASYFAMSDPAVGTPCSSTGVLLLVSPTTGNVFNCTGSVWTRKQTPFQRRGTITFTAAAVTTVTCSAAQTASEPGLTTASVVEASLNKAPDAQTVKGLYFLAYPTANTVNIVVCNPTGGNLTPAADLVFNYSAILP